MVIPTDHAERHLWMERVLRISIAHQVQSMRLMRGWTYDQAAERCGLSSMTLRRLEDPEGENPSTETLRAVARGFDVAVLIRFSSWDDLVREMAGTIPPKNFDEEVNQ